MSADGRARLVAAAVQVVQSRGYDGAGLSAILAYAGLPKGSLYHHFPAGKDEVVAAAVDFVAGEAETRIADLARAGFDLDSIAKQLGQDMAAWMAAHDWRSVGLLGALAACLPGDAPRTAHALKVAFGRLNKALAKTGAPAAAVKEAQAALLGRMILARVVRDPAAHHASET